MPYIPKEDRKRFDEALKALPVPENAGELNYLLSMIAGRFILEHGLRYQQLSDVVGAFEGAKAEFQRRVVEPYEDGKRHQNGDIEP